MYCEAHDDIRNAIEREKRIKTWNRLWKLELIETDNLDRRDLCDELIENFGFTA